MRSTLYLAGLAVAGQLVASCFGQKIEAGISANQDCSLDALTQLEATLRANPADKDLHRRLFAAYMTCASSSVQSASRSQRLAQILYWIENFPSDPVSSSPLIYVPSTIGPFADSADHQVVRQAWKNAVDRYPADPNTLLNAVRFLYPEHPEEAEQLLSSAVEREPADHRIAANLGFLYAMDILGITGPDGQAARSDTDHQRLRERAQSELDRSRNFFVVTGAGTALPNLFPHTELARVANGDTAVFEKAAQLMARARDLGAQETELQGPMPLIGEFQQFQQRQSGTLSGNPSPQGEPAPDVLIGDGSSVRIDDTVQAARLIEKPDPVYSREARQARLQGRVRLQIVVARDGHVEDLKLVFGHPLLVSAAVEAVRQYRYKPTLLNGKPVQVTSQVEVLFTFSK
jgi:TonB family protein